MKTRAKLVGLILILLILMLPILGWKLYQKADRDLHTQNAAWDLDNAIQQGRLDRVKAALDKGTPIDCKNEQCRTPLMMAAIEGNRDMVDFLLSRGANVNMKAELTPKESAQRHIPAGQVSGDGSTALMEAINYNHWESAKLLLAKGADVNIADNNHLTALSCAMGSMANIPGESSAGKEGARLLVAKGADVNVKDSYGHTLLTWALEHGDADLAAKALDHNVDVNIANASGETALLLAARGNIPDIAFKLVPKTKQIDNADLRGGTALLYAVSIGKADLVRALLKRGAGIDLSDKVGDTPLIGAAKEGQTEIVRLLIAGHASLNKQDKNGMTALGWANARGHSDIVALLKKAGAK